MAADGESERLLTIEDAKRQFVGGLTKKDFQLFAGEQAVDAFDVVELRPDSQQPVSVAFLLDESPSTQSVQDEVLRAVHTLVENSPAQMQFRVMAFASEVHAQSDWTRNHEGIRSAMQTGKGGKGTALRRSIRAAVWMSACLSGCRKRPAACT